MPLEGFIHYNRDRYDDQILLAKTNISNVATTHGARIQEGQLLRSVRRLIETFIHLKQRIFQIARIYLRASYIVYNETIRTLDIIIANHPEYHHVRLILTERVNFLGLLRERLSILLSMETVNAFLNPPSEFRFLQWGQFTEKRAIAMAMSSHHRLGNPANSEFGTFSHRISDELHEYIWNLAKRKFNARKYCRFVMAFPIGGSRLHRWMQRRSIVFPIVRDGSVDGADPLTTGGNSASPESDYGTDDEARLEPIGVGIHFPRRLFPDT